MASLKNNGLAGTPLIDIGSGSAGTVSSALFLEDGFSSLATDQAVVRAENTASLDIDWTTFGEGDKRRIEYDPTSTGSVNDSVFWPPSGLNGGGNLALYNNAITGNANIGKLSGPPYTLVETLGLPPNLSGTDPIYLDPLAPDPNLRLDYTSPVHDYCADPQIDDLDGVLRALGAGGDSGAFEIPEP